MTAHHAQELTGVKAPLADPTSKHTRDPVSTAASFSKHGQQSYGDKYAITAFITHFSMMGICTWTTSESPCL